MWISNVIYCNRKKSCGLISYCFCSCSYSCSFGPSSHAPFSCPRFSSLFRLCQSPSTSKVISSATGSLCASLYISPGNLGLLSACGRGSVNEIYSASSSVGGNWSQCVFASGREKKFCGSPYSFAPATSCCQSSYALPCGLGGAPSAFLRCGV